MKHSLRASKTPLVLSQSLQQQLNMYALAASAAGVSLLALAQSSEAKVAYTKVHQVIGTNGIYSLDLNHDGIRNGHSVDVEGCLPRKSLQKPSNAHEDFSS